jgi:ankyrin repeat protein
MYDIEKGQKSTMDDRSSLPRTATPLYYAALYGFSGLISHLVAKRAEDLNAKGGYYGTPLHASSYKGHVDVALALIDAEADMKATYGNKTLLHAAFYGGQLERCGSY